MEPIRPIDVKKQTWQAWARACAADPSSPSNLFKGALAALTGQDTCALNAIVACYELYAISDEDGRRGALLALRSLFSAMQVTTMWIAGELIPFVLDWSDRDKLWNLIVETP